MRTARPYLNWVLGLLAVEVFSWLLFWSSAAPIGLNSPMSFGYGAVMVVAIWLAWRRPQWLALATVAELMIGGKGYLLFLEVGSEKFSLRLGLFIILMAAALFRVSLLRRPPLLVGWRAPAALLAWVLVMSAVGLWRGFSRETVFFDMNGYVYILILAPWWMFIRQHKNWRTTLTLILLAAATVIGLKSWLMQALFAQNPEGILTVYRWIRQTGIGEITLISKNVYRIFFQTQIYALLGLIFVIGAYIRGDARSWWMWAWLGGSLAVYLSLSRSLWLGLGVALLGLVAVLIRQHEWRQMRRLIIVVPTAVFVWLMATWAINFPYIIPPANQPSSSDAVVARLRSAGTQQASTARANQIPPLLTAIKQSPIVGQGLGATVTYESTDPRIKGIRTTSAFELGYLDIWLHLGLIGLAVLGWWMWGVLRRLWTKPGAVMWVWPTIALATVHLTSPYLNHPLGLGWLALITLIAYDPE